MIVDCAVYRDGERTGGTAGSLSTALEHARAEHDGFVWIGLHRPTAEEFASVATEFGLHPLAVEDAVNAHQRPKIERYDQTLFVVLKTLSYDDDTEAVETGELMLFVGDGFLVTVRHGPGSALSEVRKEVEGDRELLALGPAAVVYKVADRVVDDYEAVAAELQRDVDDVEAQVFTPTRATDPERIYKLKREVLECRRAVQPLGQPMSRLATGEVRGVDPRTATYFRDVADHLLRVGEQVDQMDSLLASVLDANLAQVGIQQNDDQRKISAWAAIGLVPTLIAGFFGMNFQHMPLLRPEWGFWITVVLMAASSLGLWVRFRRAGWL